MSRKSWIEVTCDSCGWANHFPTGSTNAELRKAGIVVADKGKKHFCDRECYDSSKREE